MFKLILCVIIGLIIVGVATGGITIQFNNEKLSAIPKMLQSALTNQSLFTKTNYYFTTWKRKAELAVAGSIDKKFELDMQYVSDDTKKLKEVLDTNTNPADIISKSTLLNESIARARQGAGVISDEAIKRLRDPWLKILATADGELHRLTSLAGEYKKYQEELQKLVPPTTATPTPKPIPSAVPLKF